MKDISAVKSYLDFNNLAYITFYTKSQKPIKATIHHLPHTILAADISDGLVNMGFDIISVKQMTATHRTPPKRSATVNFHRALYPFL
jgi:hypothetical protein